MSHNKLKPVLTTIDSTNKPKIDKKFKSIHSWSFSFRYFKQIKYFGLGESEAKWFISVFEKLKELSKEPVDTFFKNHQLKNSNRFHKIDWNAKNIPIQRKDLNWIEKEILENEEEFPFFQFQISKALGRVVGFWNENFQNFFIVLLDFKHNLQPSKYYKYRVDDTHILPCEITAYMNEIDHIKGIKCSDLTCECRKALEAFPMNMERGNFVYFQLDEDFYKWFEEQTRDKSIKMIIETGLVYLNNS